MTEMRRFLVDPTCVFAERLDSIEYFNNKYGDNCVQGNPTIVNSPYGKAMSFDNANDYLDFGNISALNLTQDISIVAGVKINNTGDASLKTICAKGDGDTAYQYNFRVTQADVLGFFCTGGIAIVSTTDFTAYEDTWVQVGMSNDGTTERLLIEGGEDISDTGGSLGSVTTDSFYIGHEGVGAKSQLWDGAIAFVIVYKRALSVAEFDNINTGKAF